MGAQYWAIDLSAARWSVQSTNVSCGVCHCTVFVARHFAARVRKSQIVCWSSEKAFSYLGTQFLHFRTQFQMGNSKLKNNSDSLSPRVCRKQGARKTNVFKDLLFRMFLTGEFLHLCTSHLDRVVQVCRTHVGDININICHSHIFTDTVFLKQCLPFVAQTQHRWVEQTVSEHMNLQKTTNFFNNLFD